AANALGSVPAVGTLPLQLFVYLSSFFFNDTAPTEIYTLSLHDALPISDVAARDRELLAEAISSGAWDDYRGFLARSLSEATAKIDRKSTRLNSSHVKISYAVFCLKKKKKTKRTDRRSSEDSS